MKKILEIVENKIKKNINVEKIVILNNTDKHKTHKFFNKDKYHLHLEIESKQLRKLNKLDAQRLVMNTLKEELDTIIHALELKIK
tara:strand:+ start:659 stop:913 length:255 start_codon:yes stop_codon:yes gene_type:complete